MATYAFTTHWYLDAPIDRVWGVLHDWQQWPRWWPQVQQVTAHHLDGLDGLGGVRRFIWATPLGYQLRLDLTTTRLEEPHWMEGTAVGDLEGVGCWHLQADGEGTAVTYTWKVRTNKRWMNLLAPLARPLFAWNHDLVMRSGYNGLVRHLQAQEQREVSI